MGRARAWHLLVGVVATFAVVFQLVLVWRGNAVLDETLRPDLATRLVRFFSYFTILSNLMVAVTSLALAAGNDLSSRLWRVLRLNAVVSITVTGLVHWVALRPLLDLQGGNYVADKLLHVVVPVLALIEWLVFGPRGRLSKADLLPSAIYPALYMVYTLVRGELVGWYPYPFVDVNEHGYAVVLVNALVVIVLLVALSFAAVRLDERLPARE